MVFDSMTQFMETLPGLGNPGSDCAVMREHKVLYRHQVGYSDVEAKVAMDGSETFFLYSVSKIFTCTAAMQLYERGKFLLTDPLYEYIPEFRDMWIRTPEPDNGFRTEKAKGPVLIRHLFTMTSGLDYDLNSPAIKKVQLETGGRAPTVEVARALASQPLHFEPGTRYLYSLAHDVLGALIEVITGKSFGQYLKENILDPLELTHTRFHHAGGPLPGSMAAQYQRDLVTRAVSRIPLENEFVLGSEYECGGAGLISSADDCVRFGDALANGGVAFNGERVLGGNTIRLMYTNHLTGQALEDFGFNLSGYGYGLGVRTMMDPAVGGSNSPVGEFGWGGAASAHLLIDPVNRVSMYYATHVRNGLGGWVQPRLRNILYGCL